MDRGSEARIATGWANLAFALPALLLFGTFVLLPLTTSLWFAFTSWNGFTAPEFVGLDNFRRAFRDTVHLWSYVHVALYILGGEVIRNFVFAMLFGVLIGTYSSIFIGAPILEYLGVRRETVVGAEVKGVAKGT